MLVPGIFKLGRVSIMLQIWHLDFMHFFLPVMVGVVKILVLTSIIIMELWTLYICYWINEFFKLPFAVSFSDLFITIQYAVCRLYIYIYSICLKKYSF